MCAARQLRLLSTFFTPQAQDTIPCRLCSSTPRSCLGNAVFCQALETCNRNSFKQGASDFDIHGLGFQGTNRQCYNYHSMASHCTWILLSDIWCPHLGSSCCRSGFGRMPQYPPGCGSFCVSLACCLRAANRFRRSAASSIPTQLCPENRSNRQVLLIIDPWGSTHLAEKRKRPEFLLTQSSLLNKQIPCAKIWLFWVRYTTNDNVVLFNFTVPGCAGGKFTPSTVPVELCRSTKAVKLL